MQEAAGARARFKIEEIGQSTLAVWGVRIAVGRFVSEMRAPEVGGSLEPVHRKFRHEGTLRTPQEPANHHDN